MSQKRMFDRAIIETEKFLNISLGAKAIYFLLGMEADDEGFVSPNRVLRLYGGEAGDIKNLIDTGLIIPFKSGVVVITDWNSNNWLDQRRIKPTQHQEEKKMLGLTDNKKYVLSNGSASIEEYRVEQNRIGEREQTPAQITKEFFLKGNSYKEYLQTFSGNGVSQETLMREFDKFILYWTELNSTGTKQRWQKETTFEVKRRLVTWLGRIDKFSGNNKTVAIL